jgi:Bacterial membrane protein YfhO
VHLPARARAAAALSLAWALPFLPFLLGGVAPFYRDELLTALPLRAWASERLRAGALPQWYPFEALGVPFIGQLQTLTFHPLTLLLAPLEPLTALKLQVALAFALGLWGAYRAARALPASRPAAVTAALAFAYGGYALGISHNPAYLLAHQTLPLVLWASLRVASAGPLPRRLAALGGAWALVLLAGDLQAFALCPLLLLATLSWSPGRLRASLLGFSAAGLLALLLSAAELVPALLLSRGTIRVTGSTDPLLGRFFSFHPLRLFELAAPSLIPDALRVEVTTPLFHDGGALWSTTVFAGAVALLLAGMAPRRAWGFAALFALSLVLAMAAHAGLLPLLQKLAPPLAWFRFPEKYAGLAWVALSPLVALGFDRAGRDPGRARTVAAGACAAAALLSSCAPALVARLFTGPVEPEALSQTASAWRAGFASSALVLGAAALLLLLAARRPRALLALPVLLLLELAWGNAAHLPLAPRALLEGRHPFAEAIRAGGGGRVIPLAGGRARRTVTGGDVRWAEVMRASLRPDLGGLERLGSLAFNLPATQRRAWRALGPNASLRGEAGPLFGGCWAITDLDATPPAGAQPVLDDARLELRLLRLPCRQRVYLSAALEVDEGAAPALLRRGLPPGQSIWEGPPAPAAEGTATLLTDEPERQVIDAQTSGNTALIVSDELAPGWTATLDGAPIPLYFANVAVRGVALPAGRHRVELRYRTPGLTAGLWLSALGLLLCALSLPRFSNGAAAARAALAS